jgi:hypothetical protein
MKPVLGLAVNKLGRDFIIAWFPKVTQTTHPFWHKRDLAPAQPPPSPKNNPYIFCIATC